MPVSRDRRTSRGFGDCRAQPQLQTHTEGMQGLCEQGYLGGLSAAAWVVANPPYLRRGHRVKRWGLRGRALLGVTFLVMDIELWEAKNTADTQGDSLRHD